MQFIPLRGVKHDIAIWFSKKPVLFKSFVDISKFYKYRVHHNKTIPEVFYDHINH